MKAKKFNTKDLLNQDSKIKGRNKLVFNFTFVFNFTYLLAYSKLKHILSNIDLLLTSDSQHRKVFPEVPIVGFTRRKNLKDLLVRAKVPVEKETDGESCGCQGKRCERCTFFEEKTTFTNKEGSGTYKIRDALHLDCNSENVIYLSTCKKYKKQYVGSCITRFRTRLNNYRSCHRKFCWDHSAIQVSFHARFMLDGHCGINDWGIILIDKRRKK